ncbi:MAG: pyruvate, phosphate dikinase [Thermodesulfobacteriota bacterium]
MAGKRVYFFGRRTAEGSIAMKDVLGGKGAALADMTNLGLPVPPGFTVSTGVCPLFFANRGKLPADVIREIAANLAKLEKAAGKKFGDPKNPLLVSVRSGARFSMPGMMDSVLNIGLNDRTVEGLAAASGNPRFAYDCYRRLLAMFSCIVLGIPREPFARALEEKRQERGASSDADLEAADLKELCARFKALTKELSKRDFPQAPQLQLSLACEAVFRSWENDRAKYYRKTQGIPDGNGTAVNVQAMVFGNAGNDSATGVWFTRNPSTGAKEYYGEYLVNSQGEELVGGLRTPRHVREMRKDFPDAYDQLVRISGRLEKQYGDVQDFEFTIERNKLYMLQTRPGKRTAAAAVRVAVDMVREKLVTKEEALLRLDPRRIEQLLHPVVDPDAIVEVIARGLPASPGAATGGVVFTAEKAVERAMAGRDVILVRRETSPDDIQGMDAACGILTAKGGMTSHAAVVARQMGKTCVTGCEAIDIDEATNRFMAGGRMLREGDQITLNGATGEVILGKVPLTVPRMTGSFGIFLSWADAVRRLRVRANADTPRDARVARDFGAEGIGLCRTQHMFFAEDRIPIMQEMILARTKEDRDAALARLLPMQREDFKGLYREMKGYPVTIRLLDPPLNEFLPKREELLVEVNKLEFVRADRTLIEEKKRVLERVEELHEVNPMLGMRGCRLGICHPEITRMQVQAIFEAACEVAREGVRVKPEIMIPLVSMVSEMRAQKEIVVQAAEETMKRYRRKIPYSVGAMIEVPRAAVTADAIAREAEFFSLGTNDLTQTTFGFSRDDAGKFIQRYLSRSELCPRCGEKLDRDLRCASCGVTHPRRSEDILEADVFATVDREGVGEFVRMAVEKGRSARPGLKVGVCGEHAGDPKSVEFFDRAGLDYLSCSPYSVPVARLAAAQAALRKRQESGKGRKRD